MDRAVWSSMVLGHGGSINTSLSYMNVDVSFKLVDDKVLAAPPEHMMRLFMGKIEQLQKTVYELQETLSQKTIEAPLVQNKAQQAFVLPNGEVVILDRHRKRKFKDQKDRDETFLRLKRTLVAAGLHPGSVNMGLLGIGRGSYLDWTNSVFRPTKSPASKPMEDDQPQEPVVIQDRALASAAPITVELPVGTRVIANPNPKQAAGTKKQQLKRALEAYGEDSVIEDAEECTDGTVKKQKFKTNKGTERELLVCVENR